MTRVSEETEDSFLGIVDSFAHLIRSFSTPSSSSGSDVQSLESALEGVVRHSVEALDSHRLELETEVSQAKTIMTGLADLVDQLSQVGLGIAAIRDDSLQMEVISINALVASVRAGSQGRAFSTITSELKFITSETIQTTQSITELGEELRSDFEQFRDGLAERTAATASRHEGFLLEVRTAFDRLQQIAGSISGGLRQYQDQADALKSPLMKIIEEVQNQDRVRQSLDQVSLSLRQLDGKMTDEGANAELNFAAFRETMPELGAQVLDEVEGQLTASQVSFEKSLDAAGRSVHDVEDQRAHFVAQYLADGGSSSLGTVVRPLLEAFERSLAVTGRYTKGQHEVSSIKDRLQAGVKTLRSHLDSLTRLIERFRNIDLASRIQVARYSALDTMRDNAIEMNKLTATIGKHVADSLGQTKNFIRDFSLSLAQFDNLFERQFEASEKRDKGYRFIVHQLDDWTHSFGQVLREGAVFSQHFQTSFETTKKELNRLQALARLVEKTAQDTRRLKAFLTEEKAQVLARFGKDSWRLPADRLASMSAQFTIFAHKKLAAEIGDFEIQDSVESGEVTLF